MAGEISTAGILIYYAPESTANVCPSTGFKQKATGATLNIADYVVGVSGLGAEYDVYDVTPLAETRRHRFVKGLMGNDGTISLTANINPTSRADWESIVAEFEALTGGKSLWFEFVLPGDSDAVFFRCEPCHCGFPDVEANQAVQGTLNLIESGTTGWATKITT